MSVFQSLGNKLAGVKHTSPKGYVTYEIKPYQYNELWFAHWQWFLSNFSNIKVPIYFTVSGNQKSIKLYIKLPKKYESYLIDMFYASFESSEIKKITASEIGTKKHTFSPSRGYLKFSSGCEFFDAADFSKGW